MKFSRVTAAIIMAALSSPLFAASAKDRIAIHPTRAALTIDSSDSGRLAAKTVYTSHSAGLYQVVLKNEPAAMRRIDVIRIDAAMTDDDFDTQAAIYDTSLAPTAALGNALVFGTTDPLADTAASDLPAT